MPILHRITHSTRRSRTVAALIAAVTAVGIALPVFAYSGNSASASSSATPWLDAGMPLQARVNSLLGAMTLDEKVGQMDQQLVTTLTDTNGSTCGDNGWNMPNPACLQKILVTDHVGSVLAGGTNNPPDTTGKGGVGNTGFDWATEYNTIQQYAIKNSRLHIPLVFGVDAVHGFGHPYQAPLFPQSIGMGATWDPALAQAGGAVTADALRATGWNWDFAPVQDLARDNRWGRTYETWAEEPALSAAMGAANVKGLQAAGAGGGLKVSATVKHFAGYSQSINGHDRNEALLPLNYLQDTILPSYAGAIDAGPGAVMVDSGSINGVPATGSHYLLTDLLRDQFGFQGVVISDYQDVQALQGTYHIAADLPGAIAIAVNAGVDMGMVVNNPDQWQAAILQDVNSGKISHARIDQAVRRILTMKFQLGLFDQPCVADPGKPCVDASAANAAVTSGRDQTLKAAQESITLLRNQNNALPLPANSKVVVTGPSADSMTNQLGGWSVSWQGVFGAGHVCCMGPADQIPPGTTVKQGILGEDSAAMFAPDQATALADASRADAYVVAVGEKAYAEGLGDNPAPALPPDQQALITALEGTGKPVVVVVLAGRPVGLGAAEKANAVLMAYQGGTEAGQAVADALFGRLDPSGKLSISWPSDATSVGGDFNGGAPSPLGDQPKFFDQLSGTGSGQGHAYNPLYPFGYGLSYTTFQTTDLSVTPSVSRDGNATATFTVANTGSTAGTDIVPVYVAQPVSAVLVPPQRLVGFTRVTLGPGQSKQVAVSFPTSALGVSQGDINSSAPPSVEPGGYIVQIDKNDTTPYDVAVSAPFTIR
ncbi:MAG TPA: glycoside hydrolase family 3 N-terminal domain-containing protein [Actinocrinis sp.]|uniref:glycoside hydrolase family 3 N-terminal domain-containing protein n=1 Tax=Actinocrinis sp. TaxID=1920516 RepID=UPI002DDD6083|nr:glycoside hydrolase family 3 N-terminal domain-containing protein [Actinocrinis sp.]HEV2346851.1 glycoside hydrolase family 3 N-terminal domain-containing protein [Actinocrinis sp.]